MTGGGIRTPFSEPPAEGEAQEIAPGVLWMRLPLPMALDHVNAFAFADDDGWTTVDTGFDSRRTRAIWEALLAGPLAGRPVARLLATHHHPDHLGLAGWFQGRGAALLTSRTAWLMARMLVLDDQPRPVPQALEFWRRAGMPADLLAERAAERPFNFADVVHPLPLGYTRLTEGDRILFGGRDWLVRVGHGHAPEHLTLWSQSDDLVIGGDQLLPSISPNLGVYPSEPDADPVGEWLSSCRAFAELAEPRHLVLPGHKLPFTGLPHRLGQLIENHVSALDRMEAAMALRPMSAVDAFETLFKRPIGRGEFGLALVEAVAHVNHLRRQGRVHKAGERDGAVLWGA
ncbi:MBL fold metallo-hydrolase (plasmid) [Paracoccus sp. TK19116]|uniref:MBL fold metallo-hydrolase n=1 Tax=Paracoccus albicereus TaxID=2922394 RepID=A0ABT1ML40_9RHOB|nr:MBL fold metallo-hydrolase [Paracoccus albicereus]MCQ0969008.1 MBL fold metallo-hydrolase [Paracoccus albicereus]